MLWALSFGGILNLEKTLVILGSARTDSNTLLALQSHSAFKHLDRHSNFIFLNEKNVQHYSYENCREDDFLAIVSEMVAASEIVFATPVYWYAMSGTMKVFFDRFTELITTSKHLGRQLAKKNVYLIATGSDPSLPPGFEEPFKRTCKYFALNFKETYYFPAANLKTASNLQAAKTFAQLMDNNLFEEAQGLMHPSCVYYYRDKIIQGAQAIIEVYKSNYETGAKKLDEILFSSKVEEMTNKSFKLKYLDRIRKRKSWHEYHCEQHIKIEEGLVTQIIHVDLPGEVEKLNQWLENT